MLKTKDKIQVRKNVINNESYKFLEEIEDVQEKTMELLTKDLYYIHKLISNQNLLY